MKNSWGRSGWTGPRKYKNVKVRHDGIVFDSEGELSRYLVLQDKLRLGEIQDFMLKPAFPLELNGVLLFERPFHPDFAYRLTPCPNPAFHDEFYGREFQLVRPKLLNKRFCPHCCIVEDFKGFLSPGDAATRIFKIQCNLLKAIYGVEVRVVQTQLAVRRQEAQRKKKQSDRYLIRQVQKQEKLRGF